MTTLSLPRLPAANIAPAASETPWLLEHLGRPLVAFAVHGDPAPQGSKSYKGQRVNKQTGRSVAIMAESSKKVAPWRKTVAQVAAMAVGFPGPEWTPLNGALVVDMVFTMPRPASFPARDPRREHGRPAVMPDLSKLARSTEDALTRIVWHDDSRVVGYRRLEKVYVGQDDPDALRAPGAVVRVWMVGP